jgi:hypothetical protein
MLLGHSAITRESEEFSKQLELRKGKGETAGITRVEQPVAGLVILQSRIPITRTY